MLEQTRRAIAHSAAAQINGRAKSSVFSYAAGKHTNMSGNDRSFYDYDARAHISKSGSGLYHYGTGSHISLKINGTAFSGYDYGSGSHFSGKVKGRNVEVFDYGEGRYFNYQS